MKLRSLLAVAIFAPAVALAAPQSGSSLSGVQVGGFLGYETSDFSGFALRLDGEIPFRDLSPTVKMSWVGSIGYSWLSWNYLPGYSVSAGLFKLVPAARFTLPLNPQFEVFGDAGIGIAHVGVSVEYADPFPPFGRLTASTSSTNLMMRFGVGAWYKANPQLKVGAMLDFDPIFGDFGTSGYGVGTENTFSILVGLMYRI